MNTNDLSEKNKGNAVLPLVSNSADLMPCGSPHSCLDCVHAVMVTRPCSYLSRMTEGEVDYHMDKLRGKV